MVKHTSEHQHGVAVRSALVKHREEASLAILVQLSSLNNFRGAPERSHEDHVRFEAHAGRVGQLMHLHAAGVVAAVRRQRSLGSDLQLAVASRCRGFSQRK